MNWTMYEDLLKQKPQRSFAACSNRDKSIYLGIFRAIILDEKYVSDKLKNMMGSPERTLKFFLDLWERKILDVTFSRMGEKNYAHVRVLDPLNKKYDHMFSLVQEG